MKSIFLAAAAAASLGSAQAATFIDYAPVLSANPLYDQVASRDCVDVPAVETYEPTGAGNVLGGVVGGVLGGLAGHAMGGGRGKTVLTIGGALGGALAGRQLANTSHSRLVNRQDCQESVHPEFSGYSVTYSYRGRVETTTLPYNPGSRLEMQVTAQPVLR